MFKEVKSIFKTFIFTVGFFQAMFLLSSCGFVYKKHVIGKYYFIGVDSKEDISLSYELGNGDFIGKVPGRITHYGYNDTFLIAKTQEYGEVYPTYYIIDMRKDSELAHEADFRIGPFFENSFDSTWKAKLQVKMKPVEY